MRGLFFRFCAGLPVLLLGCAIDEIVPATPITPHTFTADDYPPASVVARETGRVSLRYLIREDGTIGDIEVTKSSGFERLDNASVELVRTRWLYAPAKQGGRPVTQWTTANVEWVLRPGSAPRP